MKKFGAVVLALFLVGLMAGSVLAAPQKPAVRNVSQQKNYGLLTLDSSRKSRE